MKAFLERLAKMSKIKKVYKYKNYVASGKIMMGVD